MTRAELSLTLPGQHVATRMLRQVPPLFIGIRCLLGPLLVLLTQTQSPATWLIVLLLAAMLSDIFDGVIARRLGIATASLRVADSRADAWFFACSGLSAWIAAPEAIRGLAVPIIAALVLQIASYAYDLARYRRIVCLHAYSAKIWGLSLYLSLTSLIAFHWGAMLWLSFGLGIVSFLDAAAIKLILPGWRHDVLSCVHALKIRQSEIAVQMHPLRVVQSSISAGSRL